MHYVSILKLRLPGCKVQISYKHSQIKIILVWKIVYFEHQIGKTGAHNKTLSQLRLSEIVKPSDYLYTYCGMFRERICSVNYMLH